jgi:acyl-CoA hydrolase
MKKSKAKTAAVRVPNAGRRVRTPQVEITERALPNHTKAGAKMKLEHEQGSDDGLPLAPKTVRESQSEMVEAVLPNDANPLGYLLGGRVMHWIDIAGALAAHRHANSPVVTASVDYVDFRNPVRIGDILILQSRVNRVFHTSMEVGVKVFSENVITGKRQHTSSAYLTFVAVDAALNRHPIRPLIVKTPEERRRFREAGLRRKIRLAHRDRKKRRRSRAS